MTYGRIKDMRWKILLILFVIAIVTGVALRWLPADFLSGEKEAAPEIELIALQETANKIAPPPEEEKAAEPEKKSASDVSEPKPAIAKAPESSSVAGVPFTVQAPFGEWNDPIFQNGCEEAALVMAAHWLSGKPLTKEIARQEIAALASFAEEKYGQSVDTSAADTAKLLAEYYGVTTAEVRMDIGQTDIRDALSAGALVIVPADGRKLKNPNYKQPGPTTHMLVITGYDAETKAFITNDPGTRRGEGYRYAEDILYGAIRDYPTGDHLPITGIRKAMIVVRKP